MYLNVAIVLQGRRARQALHPVSGLWFCVCLRPQTFPEREEKHAVASEKTLRIEGRGDRIILACGSGSVGNRLAVTSGRLSGCGMGSAGLERAKAAAWPRDTPVGAEGRGKCARHIV